MDDWQLISTAPLDTRILLWCPELRRGEPVGLVFGTVAQFSTGERRAYGAGMNGDWLFTHWMKLPEPPNV